VEQRSDESAEAEVRDLDAKLPPPPTPADLGGDRIRPAALVRWGFFAGVGLLLAYGAAQALLSVRNLLVLVLVAMFLAVSLDPAVRWLTARGLPRGLAVTLILVVLVAILAAFLVSVIPHLVSQFTTLVHTLPSYLAVVPVRVVDS
jgi:predicted PurR-regulated permease PerM